MIADAWVRYAGWDRSAIVLQASARGQRRWALLALTATALLGAVAATADTFRPLVDHIGKAAEWLTWLHLPGQAAAEQAKTFLSTHLEKVASAGAGVTGGLATWQSRLALAAGLEARWIRARATAEAIKRECFLAAARAGDYAGTEARQRLVQNVETLEQDARRQNVPRVSLLAQPLGWWRRVLRFLGIAGRPADPLRGCPSEPDSAAPLTLETYRRIRIVDQRDWYARRGAEHGFALRWLTRITQALSGAAVLLGGGATFAEEIGLGSALAAWIAFFSTAGTSVAAWGMAQRRGFLATSYAAMAERLSSLDQEAHRRGWSLPDLVQACEELLGAEHSAWVERIRHAEETEPMPEGVVATAPA